MHASAGVVAAPNADDSATRIGDGTSVSGSNRESKPRWRSFGHRPALDGIRAVAALLVVLFHSGVPGLSNGFVGVDVFFVLSGFLITSLLVRERLADGRIKLMAFYARRARRLFPAALTVLVVTAAAYQIVASPLAVLENRWGFVFAAVYVSNWYFLAESQDYFAEDGSPSPVLHYWSLSVEEQFYLVWPVLFIGLFAIPVVRRKLGPWVLGVLAVGALAYSAWVATEGTMPAYFGTFARAYQLIFGAALGLLAFWVHRRRQERYGSPDDAPPKRRIWSWAGWVFAPAGLLILFWAASDFGPTFAWWVGIFGVIGTLLLLAGLELASDGPTARVLASPVPRTLGKWSYSIYLWHWPIIVIGAEMGVLSDDWRITAPVVTALSIGLAAFSWLVIEGPISSIPLRQPSVQRRAVLLGICATLVTAAVVATILRAPAAAQSLFLEEQSEQTETFDTASIGPFESQIPAPGQLGERVANVQQENGQNAETLVAGSADPDAFTVMVAGDSHVFPWRSGLVEAARKGGFRVVVVAATTCPWMEVAAYEDDGVTQKDCKSRLWDPMIQAAQTYEPDITVLVSRSVLVRTLREGKKDYAPDQEGWIEVVEAGANRMLDRIEPYTGPIYLVQPTPETEVPMDRCLSTGAPPEQCAAPQIILPGTEQVEELWPKLAQERGGIAIDLDNTICPSGICPAQADGLITYRDNDHLTFKYAASLIPLLQIRYAEQVTADLEKAGG